MMRRSSSVVHVSILLVLLGTLRLAVAQEEAAERFEKVAQRLVKAINAEDYRAVRLDFSERMLADLSLDASKQFFRGLVNHFGRIEKLDSARVTAPDRAVFSAHCARRNLEITIQLDEDNKVAGLSFLPAATQSAAIPDKLVTSFQLPFEGQWLVLWGGDSRELNQHHDTPYQRFAFDFLIVDREGRSYRDEGKENTDYYAFGKPVLAPADGAVTDVITGVRDNSPGSMNPVFAGGNTIVLAHRANEVSVLGHLQYGSIRVKCGDKVKRGDILALCGNSGYSSEPHVHFHIQNTTVLQDGTGLKCAFERIAVTRNEKSELKTNYSPVKGDLVKQE